MRYQSAASIFLLAGCTTVNQYVAPGVGGGSDAGPVPDVDASSGPHIEALADASTEDADAAGPQQLDGGIDGGTGVQLYYAACLTELAYGQPKKVLNFWVYGDFSSATIRVQPLAVVADAPPPTFSSAGRVGSPVDAIVSTSNGLTSVTIGNWLIPGSANPISGSDIQIDDAALTGHFPIEKGCGEVHGRVVEPAAAARTLSPPSNVCLFVALPDGAMTPSFQASDFSSSACPQ